MTSVIPFDVTGVANVATTSVTLENYIGFDLIITTLLVSVVYNGVDTLTVTFNSNLSQEEIMEVDDLFHIIVLGEVPGEDLYVDKKKEFLTGVTAKPGINTDYNAGFVLGSIVVFNDMIFTCVSNSIGAAHWGLINNDGGPMGYLSFATNSPSVTNLSATEYLIGEATIPYDNANTINRSLTLTTSGGNNVGFSWAFDEQVNLHGKLSFYVPQSVVTDPQVSQLSLYLKKNGTILGKTTALYSDQITKNSLYELSFDVMETLSSTPNTYEMFLNASAAADVAITRYEFSISTI